MTLKLCATKDCPFDAVDGAYCEMHEYENQKMREAAKK